MMKEKNKGYSRRKRADSWMRRAIGHDGSGERFRLRQLVVGQADSIFQVGIAEISTRQVNVVHIGPVQISTVQIGSTQVREQERCEAQVDILHVGTVQTHARKIGITQVQILQMSVCDIDSAHTDDVKIVIDQVRIIEAVSYTHLT